MKDYALETDVAEKLRKAEVLYEKIILLFLADLGLRIQFPENKPIQKILAGPPTAPSGILPGDLPQYEYG